MTRYHPALVVLHWLLAAMIIGGLVMGGTVLAETPNSDPFKLVSLRMHMSIGMLILVLMLIRLVVRLRSAKPPHADIGNALLNRIGIWIHWAFYIVVIAMAASGIGISLSAGLPDIVFGGSGVPLPADFSAYPPRAAHGILSNVLGLLILGHLTAFAYHQFLRKDGLFSRMWFGNRRG